MPSPVPRNLRSDQDHDLIEPRFRDHVVNMTINPSNGVKVKGSQKHPAKYAPGLSTVLTRLAGSTSVGDPMAGTGTIAYETGLKAALNDIDPEMSEFLTPLSMKGCEISFVPASEIQWTREVCIFSPPYYPRTDRKKPNAHDDEKRGPVVGFRDSYKGDHPSLVGNPGGVNAIKIYRQQMVEIYAHMKNVCSKMVVVTKNWTRLGVELRLDLDTILMCQETGWKITERHGFTPTPSLWSKFNASRGGGVQIEDILIFER